MRIFVGLIIVSSAVIAFALIGVELSRRHAALPVSFHPASPITGSMATTPVANAPKPKSRTNRKPAAPLDPLVVVAREGSNPEIVAWFQNWQANWVKGKELPTEQREKLNNVLKRTSFSTDNWFELAHGFHHKYLEHSAASIMYSFAANSVRADLTNARSDADRLKMLHDIKTAHQDFKDVLWPLIENQSENTEALRTLTSLYSDFVKFCPADDKSLASENQAMKTGLAECMYLNGHVDDALALLEEDADNDTLKSDRKIARDWIWGLVLYQKSEFKEAASHFECVALSKQQEHHTQAWPLFIMSLAKSGDRTEAANRFNTWLDECHPAVSDAVRVLAIVKAI